MTAQKGFSTVALLVGGGVIVILLLVVIISLGQTKKPSQQPAPVPTAVATFSPTPQPTNYQSSYHPPASPIPLTATVVAGKPNAGWQTYDGSGISFLYPDSWEVSSSPISGGGISVDATGSATLQSQSKQVLSIQIFDATKVPTQQVEPVFTGLGYKKSQILLTLLPADQFQGSLPLGSPPLQETAVVFSYNGKTYEITFDYNAPQVDPQEQQTFTKIVDSLQFPG